MIDNSKEMTDFIIQMNIKTTQTFFENKILKKSGVGRLGTHLLPRIANYN